MPEADKKAVRDFKKLDRLRRVARLYLEGKAQVDIAQIAKVTQTCISNDLKEIREAWVKSTLIDFNEAKARELARLDHIEEMAWKSYYLSLEDAENKSVEVEKAIKFIRDESGGVTGQELVPVKTSSKKATRSQAGDPRWISEIRMCVDMRCKILGIYKDPGTTVNNLIVNFDQLFGKTVVTEDNDPIEQRIKAEAQGVLTNGQAREEEE